LTDILSSYLARLGLNSDGTDEGTLFWNLDLRIGNMHVSQIKIKGKKGKKLCDTGSNQN